MEIYIWGTGCAAGDLISQGISLEQITAFIDNAPKMPTFLDKPVILPKDLDPDHIDLIIVTSRHSEAIRSQCLSMGIPADVLYFTKNNQILSDLNTNCNELITNILPSDVLNAMNTPCHVIRSPLAHPDSLPIAQEAEADYVRIKTLELLTHHIESIPGAIAELGVYRGFFARIMNQLMPSRIFHLFDSFEGFDPSEAAKEIDANTCTDSFVSAHKDTTLHRVLSIMPHPEQIIVHQGYFPESLHGLDEQFALVSLDVDFEDTTYEGLSYFWPRLNSGGYLLLHDFHSLNLTGVKHAVKRYETEKKIHLPGIPLCDIHGTLVLCKP